MTYTQAHLREAYSPEIFQALLRARKNLMGLERTSRNDFQKFNYVSAEDTINQCMTALLREDIIVDSEWHKLQDSPHRNGEWIHVDFHIQYHNHETAKVEMHDRESEYPVVARSGMPEDKAVNCGLTADIAYWFRGFLMLPRVEKGTDIDSFDDKQHNVITPETDQSIDALLEIMRESQPKMTRGHLTSLLRDRAKSANVPLDETFVEACIDKAQKGKKQ